MVDLSQPFLAFNGGGGDWETIGRRVSEDGFPSDHPAWTISRHRNRRCHLLIFRRQQANYSLNSCRFQTSFNDICYFNFTPNSFLFKCRRGKERVTISAFHIRILTFCFQWQGCSAPTLFLVIFPAFPI